MRGLTQELQEKKSTGTLGRLENKVGRQGAFSKQPEIIAHGECEPRACWRNEGMREKGMGKADESNPQTKKKRGKAQLCTRWRKEGLDFRARGWILLKAAGGEQREELSQTSCGSCPD